MEGRHVHLTAEEVLERGRVRLPEVLLATGRQHAQRAGFRWARFSRWMRAGALPCDDRNTNPGHHHLVSNVCGDLRGNAHIRRDCTRSSCTVSVSLRLSDRQPRSALPGRPPPQRRAVNTHLPRPQATGHEQHGAGASSDARSRRVSRVCIDVRAGGQAGEIPTLQIQNARIRVPGGLLVELSLATPNDRSESRRLSHSALAGQSS